MKYKLVCINQEGSIILDGDEELKKAIQAKKKNQPAVFYNGIVLNWNMYSGIVEAVEANREDADRARYKMEKEKSSPFAKFLAPKLQLSPEIKTLALEEASEQERELRNEK
jgi:hypothetical protein